MIVIIAGMQLHNTCLSSLAGIIPSSHDLVGMSIITLYGWFAVGVVNLLSAGVSYALGVYGLKTVGFDLIFFYFI